MKTLAESALDLEEAGLNLCAAFVGFGYYLNEANRTRDLARIADRRADIAHRRAELERYLNEP